MPKKIKVGNVEVEERTRKVYVWQCPYCARTIESLYLKQLVTQARQHLMKHEG